MLQVPTKGKKKCKAGVSAKKLKLHEACALIPDLYRAKLLQNAVDDEEGTLPQPLANFVMNELVRHVTSINFVSNLYHLCSTHCQEIWHSLACSGKFQKLSETDRRCRTYCKA